MNGLLGVRWDADEQGYPVAELQAHGEEVIPERGYPVGVAVTLDVEEVSELVDRLQAVLRAMRWHRAGYGWVASWYGGPEHLATKDACLSAPRGRTLCGVPIGDRATWPLRGAPMVSGSCATCREAWRERAGG